MRENKKRSGTILIWVLVTAVVLLAVFTFFIRWNFQRRRQAAKTLYQSELGGETENLRATITACLDKAGYPAGSCSPNAAQAACIHSGVAVVFGGTPPACQLKITVFK